MMTVELSRLRREATVRRKPSQFMSVTKSAVQDYLDDGWEIDRELKVKTRIRKLWAHDQRLENRVWHLFYMLGYPKISSGRNFKVTIHRKTVRHNNNNFIKYNENIFSWADQVRLAESLSRAANRGASVFVSNANHSCIRKLYKANIWQHITVNRFSKIASSSEHRKGTTELVISNYLTKSGKQEDLRF